MNYKHKKHKKHYTVTQCKQVAQTTDEEKMFKAVKEKGHALYREIMIRVTFDFSSDTVQVRG